MKTTFISGIRLTLLSMLLTAITFAQKSDYKNEAAYKFSSHEISKGVPSFSNDINISPESENISEKKFLNILTRYFAIQPM